VVGAADPRRRLRRLAPSRGRVVAADRALRRGRRRCSRRGPATPSSGAWRRSLGAVGVAVGVRRARPSLGRCAVRGGGGRGGSPRASSSSRRSRSGRSGSTGSRPS
jgi:hypothetical protein